MQQVTGLNKLVTAGSDRNFAFRMQWHVRPQKNIKRMAIRNPDRRTEKITIAS